MISQQTQVTGQVEQTPRTEDKSWTRQKRSERQPQSSQQTDEITTGSTAQTQAGNFYTQGSTCDYNRGTNSHHQDRSHADRASTQHYQTQAGSHTQIHTQMVEQAWGQQTGSDSIQTQGSIYDQSTETVIHGQDRNQASQSHIFRHILRQWNKAGASRQKIVAPRLMGPCMAKTERLRSMG